MLFRIALGLCLLCVSCSSPSTLEGRMENVAGMYLDQLDDSEQELDAVEATIEATECTDKKRLQLHAMATEIRSDILETRLEIAQAHLGLNTSVLKGIGKDIVTVFEETSELRLLVIEASMD